MATKSLALIKSGQEILSNRLKSIASRSPRSQIRLPGLKPGVRSGLILSGAFFPDLKIGV
jgi:hypothetical protein